MKRKKIFGILLALCLCCLSFGCGGSAWKSEVPATLPVGEILNFYQYLNVDAGTDVSVEYETPSGERIQTGSLYFVGDSAGRYTFTITFSSGGKRQTVNCTVEVVPNAPQVTEASAAVRCSKGETVTFSRLFARSGIRVIPAADSEVTFVSVDYYRERISVENYESEVERTTFSDADDSYTFSDAGSYIFHLNIHNVSGSEQTDLSVSVADSDAELPEGVSADGLLPGEQGAVKLLRASGTGALSYIGYDETYALQPGEFLCMQAEFSGRNAPQLLFGADVLDGRTSFGRGFIVSLEHEPPYDRMRVYGPNRFASGVVSFRENSFGRQDLTEGTVYVWKLFIAKLDANTSAVKSILYKKGADGQAETVATYHWAPFADGGSVSGYAVFLGSADHDIIFRSYEPAYCDREGNLLKEAQK